MAPTEPPAGVPEPHAAFLRQALSRLRDDPRLVGVAAGGSFPSRSLDEFSDLDLVLAVEPAAYASVTPDRQRIAASLGPLLAAFTGEHVGEPRLLICLYGPPLLHVDLKFVSLEDMARRVEDPEVLWERGGRMSAALGGGETRYPAPQWQWIEDRFWTWIHYGAGKVGRGELFEAQDMLAFLRAQVLGPLSLQEAGARPQGVRRIESAAPGRARQMQATVAPLNAGACLAALRAAAEMYRDLRRAAPAGSPARAAEAEAAALGYLDEIARGLR